MQIGMIGLGRMGANMVRRLMRAGHECVVYDRRAQSVAMLVEEGAQGAESLAGLVARLAPPRVAWIMVPAGAVGATLDELRPVLARGDIVVDGGNSNWRDAIVRARELQARGVHFVDVGTSGGVFGLQNGYCLMIGGEPEPVDRLEPLFAALAPPQDSAPPLAGGAAEIGSAERGWLHCGPAGAGHFVKMVHNGIEYALMAAYAEGLNLLAHAGRGRARHAADAESVPLAEREAYQFDLNVPAIAELWRRGSVVRSWLLDLTAEALRDDPRLERFSGRVSDSGEGRWTLQAAIDLGIPMPALAAALFERFGSQGENTYANQVLSAMRFAFGGHEERER